MRHMSPIRSTPYGMLAPRFAGRVMLVLLQASFSWHDGSKGHLVLVTLADVISLSDSFHPFEVTHADSQPGLAWPAGPKVLGLGLPPV